MNYTDLDAYDYVLPPDLIAQKSLQPQDQARLLIYDKDTDHMDESDFFHLPDFVDKNCIFVFNDTKVIPARVYAKRKTGGKVEVFFLQRLEEFLYKVFLSRYIPVAEELVMPGGERVEVIRQEEKYFIVKTKRTSLELLAYLETYGTMPVPPYIDNPSNDAVLRKEYQAVFAKYYGSIAAPTASLHFTRRLIKKLHDKKIPTHFITLHVGLGTFAPLEKAHFEKNILHRETYEIKPRVWNALASAKKDGKKIVAVGTTVVRTLESAVRSAQVTGSTDLFITPGFSFQMIDALITNFHLPRSSLLLLVSAFIESRERTLSLYEYAVKQKYRFFSFGDGMFIK